MSYDVKCHNLAIDFLEDLDRPIPDSVIAKLAQTIQDTIEDFLSDLERDRVQELEAARDEADDRRGKERDEWRHEAAEWQRLK